MSRASHKTAHSSRRQNGGKPDKRWLPPEAVSLLCSGNPVTRSGACPSNGPSAQHIRPGPLRRRCRRTSARHRMRRCDCRQPRQPIGTASSNLSPQCARSSGYRRAPPAAIRGGRALQTRRQRGMDVRGGNFHPSREPQFPIIGHAAPPRTRPVRRRPTPQWVCIQTIGPRARRLPSKSTQGSSLVSSFFSRSSQPATASIYAEANGPKRAQRGLICLMTVMERIPAAR
ncbi:hypothetical protein GGC65_003970 [Sphingopyxis sp. OAS728]|nr:hypothetical protein [Sphingopyxis sp. OAS728]